MPQPIKPPTAAERKILREQYGFTDEEIDRDYQASLQPTVTQDVTGVRASMGITAPKETESWSPRGKLLSVARELAQGPTFGFGEELEAGLGALSPSRTYEGEKERIRGEMKAFKEAYPKTAFAANVAGNVLTPIPGSTTRSLGQTALLSALEGAASAAGSAEGDLKDRGTAALFGGVMGGGLGTIASSAGRAMATRAQRLGRAAPADVEAVAKAASRAGFKTPQELEQAAISMSTDVPTARVVDVLGAPGARRARTIRGYGGEAGTFVEKKVAEQAGESPASMQALLTRTTGISPENALETIEQSIARGKSESEPLYKALYAQKPKANPEIDAILATDFGQKVLARAERNASNERRRFMISAKPEKQGLIFNQFGQPVITPGEPAKYIPQSLDDIKKAMDDIIYEGKYGRVEPGQGGILPGEVRAAKKLRGDFVTQLDAMYPVAAEARQAWAGEKALRDAFEGGQEASSKKIDPRQIVADLKGMDASEQAFFKRGHLDGMRRMIDEGQTLPINNQAFKQRIQAIYGDNADQVLASLKTQADIVKRNQFITAGSQTAEKALDIAEEGGKTPSAKFMQMLTSPKMAALQGLGKIEQSLISPRFDARRLQEAQALFSEAGGIGPLISRIEKEIAVQRRGSRVGGAAAAAAARGAGGWIGRVLNPSYPEQ